MFPDRGNLIDLIPPKKEEGREEIEDLKESKNRVDKTAMIQEGNRRRGVEEEKEKDHLNFQIK